MNRCEICEDGELMTTLSVERNTAYETIDNINEELERVRVERDEARSNLDEARSSLEEILMIKLQSNSSFAWSQVHTISASALARIDAISAALEDGTP